MNVIDLTTEEYKDYPKYEPSEGDKVVIKNTFDRFHQSRLNRDQSFEYFDGLNLIEYIDDSVRRFSTNIDEREGLEDWQARIHDPFTRNKVNTILGKAVATLPIASFKGRGEEDIRKGIILTNLYEFAEEQDDYEEFMTQILLEAIVKGTAIGYEGVTRNSRKIRNVKGVGDDIKVTEITEKETLFPASIVPLEEFYPSHVGIRTIKKMPYCFWRTTVSYSEFMSDWSEYSESKYVLPNVRSQESSDKIEQPFYIDYVSSDVHDGDVEIIRYYSKIDDEFVILANGVWINPITISDKKEISPIPFNHKELPFFDIKFDFFGDWFFGKSLPDKLKSMQDVLNVLTNMLLDQSFMTIFPPMLTNGFDSIEDDYLRPGRRTPIDTQGLPLNQSFMKLDLGTPSGWHQYILEYTRKIMSESSVDSVSSGNAGVGGRTTAQEIQTAASAVAQTLGIFGAMVKSGIKRKAHLKAANILQFATNEKVPLVERLGSEDGAEQFSKAFNIIKVEDTYLTDGRRGTKVIEFYKDKTEMPIKEELQARSVISEAESGKAIEIVAMPAQYIRNFIYDTVVQTNPKNESSKEIEKALQLEKVKVYLSFFPETVDKAELFAQTAEKMGDDPSKIIKQEALNPQPQQAPQPGGEQLSIEPTGNTSGNLVESAMGGQPGLNSLQVQLNGEV